MKSLSLTLSLAGLLAFALPNCTGVHAPHESHSLNAVMCDKCKTTWVLRGQPGAGGKVTTFKHEKAMTCPDCVSAVENFVKTGKFEGYCAHCKGTMTCSTGH